MRKQQDEEIDYLLLQQIVSYQETNQRDLALRMGISVGKLNYCLRAVIDRGWVKVNNFRRSDNKLAYAYLLTPNGVLAKMKMARAFLERKGREFTLLQAEIYTLRRQLYSEPPVDAFENHSLKADIS